MIETLIAVGVVSVGLVSIAGLALVNLQSTSHGHSQSQATIIAEELADTRKVDSLAEDVTYYRHVLTLVR